MYVLLEISLKSSELSFTIMFACEAKKKKIEWDQ